MFHLTGPIFCLGILFCVFYLLTQSSEKALSMTINTVGILVIGFVILIWWGISRYFSVFHQNKITFLMFLLIVFAENGLIQVKIFFY